MRGGRWWWGGDSKVITQTLCICYRRSAKVANKLNKTLIYQTQREVYAYLYAVIHAFVKSNFRFFELVVILSTANCGVSKLIFIFFIKNEIYSIEKKNWINEFQDLIFHFINLTRSWTRTIDNKLEKKFFLSLKKCIYI